jgi:hypothetical protein
LWSHIARERRRNAASSGATLVIGTASWSRLRVWRSRLAVALAGQRGIRTQRADLQCKSYPLGQNADVRFAAMRLDIGCASADDGAVIQRIATIVSIARSGVRIAPLICVWSTEPDKSKQRAQCG